MVLVRRALLACVLLFSTLVYADIDLRPLPAGQWDERHAAHLLSRAGFGGTPDEVAALHRMGLAGAINHLLEARDSDTQFDRSGVFDPGLDPFPPSRPATTRMAKARGEALGVKVKAGGNRPLQPVVNKFFYWLRASRLETDRVAYWWADRMVAGEAPLQHKMALFWHGHFATNEDKVRDYRKMLKQLRLLQDQGLGNFRDLLIGVAQDPAMLVFLDAGVNTKDSPNENFAREIMELFTMGVGNYGERDVQEAARAFTGWDVDGLDFVVNQQAHDSATKEFLGRSGPFDGVEVIDIILQQPVTAEFIAGKIYRYFVSEDLDAVGAQQLGRLLRDVNYDISAYLRAIFSAREFYLPGHIGSRIKGPVELMISTYRLLDLERAPGVPDFNVVAGALGQRLMHPPTVAGWSHGRSWITPSLMFERGNFVLDVLYPDIGFVAPDRYPGYTAEIVNVQNRLRQGMSVSQATKPTGITGGEDMMAASNLLADRDEEFNTRLGSMRGWQMALERVKPLSRHTARLRLTAEVTAAELSSPREVVDYYAQKFFAVQPDGEVLDQLSQHLEEELGTPDIDAAISYLEEPLRNMLHAMLSLPEYQLG
ncbi:MAG: DUF1800 domain-containing protein [Pseudomonadota bacterium]